MTRFPRLTIGGSENSRCLRKEPVLF